MYIFDVACLLHKFNMYVSVNACTCIDVYSIHFSSKCLALYPVFNIDRYYQEELLILHIEPYTVSNI